jgi:hypothetical protein
MEARVAVLEANIGNLRDDMSEIRKDVREIRSDLASTHTEFHRELGGLRSEMSTQFRWTIGILGGLIIGLAGLMAKGFHWL